MTELLRGITLFFEKGLVSHVSLASPTCKRLQEKIYKLALNNKIKIHSSGTYLVMEGPQFSTFAESKLYKEVWNCDVIGMTNMPEAKLAREAEICYAPIAMVTDFDCWHPEHENVTVTDIINTMGKNAKNAQKLILDLINNIEIVHEDCTRKCDKSLENSLITSEDKRIRLF